MSNLAFRKILYEAEIKTENSAFAEAYSDNDLRDCILLDEVVKVLDVFSEEENLTQLKIEKNETEYLIFTDKNTDYFEGLKDKKVYFSGLKKKDLKKFEPEKWYIRACRDVTEIEESIVKSNLFAEEEKIQFLLSTEKFSPHIRKDLAQKMIAVANSQINNVGEEKQVHYKDDEEMNALYEIIKGVIPLEFRRSYEEAKYRLGKNISASENRNYRKQMEAILSIDWCKYAEYKYIDISSIKDRMEEIHNAHYKQLEQIYRELRISNITQRPPRTINLVCKNRTLINMIAKELGRAIAEETGSGYATIDSERHARHPEEVFCGTRKIYENAHWGLIFERILEVGPRGILVLEDVDLWEPRVRDVLFPLLEKSRIHDNFAEVAIDLSKLFVIVTCSTIKDIPMSIRSNMIPIYFPDLEEQEIIDRINKIILPKYCKQFNLKYTKEIPQEACRTLIYKYANLDLNKLDSVICDLVIKTVDKGENSFPDFSHKAIDEFEFSKEDYVKIRNEFVRETTAVENKFFACYDEYPEKIQKKVVELLDVFNWETDECRKEYARDCMHYLVNIFKVDVQPFVTGSIIEELTKTHYLPNDLGDRIEAAILSKNLDNNSKCMTVIGLKGNAGTGKTSTAKSIAKALGRNYIKVNVGSSGGAETVKGFNKIFPNAGPSMIIRELSKSGHGSYSDVLIFDEIDKATPDFYNSLYEFFDPNEEYLYDQYLECYVPKKDFVVIVTFNEINNIPLPIRDRMQIIEYTNYSIHDKKYIITKHILAKIRARYSIDSIEMETKALDTYIENYDISPGMRDVERDIEYVLMKMTNANNGILDKEVLITTAHIIDALGEKRRDGMKVSALSLGRCGIAQALAATSDGTGVCIAVETVINPYQEEAVEKTGLLEGSCLESVSLARCLVSKYMNMKLPKLHIHMAEATRKDGPSAGVAITMSILSCLLEKNIPNIAFTGSIDLSGNIGNVGGVFEKCIAAEHAAIEKVYVPTVCYKMLVDSKQLERLNVKVVPVDTIYQVIKLVWGMEV